MNAFRLPASRLLGPPAPAAPTQWLNVLVELEQATPAELATRDRGQRYALLAERTHRQRAALELWIADQDFGDEVLSICEMESMGMLLIQCTHAVAAQLTAAPGVASVAVTGAARETSAPTALRYAHA